MKAAHVPRDGDSKNFPFLNHLPSLFLSSQGIRGIDGIQGSKGNIVSII